MARVFIGRLADKASERDIERFFKGYGRIKDIRLKTGYGFVEFESERDADDAIHDLHHKELAGGRVVLELARSGRRSPQRFDSSRRYAGNAPVRTEYRLLVENLPSRVSWQDLKDLMRKTGEVMFADAHKRRQNEGIVEFKTRSDMKAALKKFDGYELSGRKIRVYEDNVRGRSRSRRSRSASTRSSHNRRDKKRSARRSTSSRRKSSRRSSSRSRSSRRRRTSTRSRSPVKVVKGRKHSTSRSKTPIKSKSAVKSASPTKNGTDSREHSISPKKDRSVSKCIDSPRRSRSASMKKGSHSDTENHKSVSRDGSEVSRSVSKERSVSASKECSRSRSASKERSQSRSVSKERSRSLSASKERSHSRSASNDSN